MIISFGWTWPALLASVKSVTRREWNEAYAHRFKADMVVKAYDRSPRFGGRHIADIELIAAPYLEPLSEMPDSDYEAEGFDYLHRKPHLLPKSMKYDVSREGFEAWRNSGGSMWVVRFRILRTDRNYDSHRNY